MPGKIKRKLEKAGHASAGHGQAEDRVLTPRDPDTPIYQDQPTPSDPGQAPTTPTTSSRAQSLTPRDPRSRYPEILTPLRLPHSRDSQDPDSTPHPGDHRDPAARSGPTRSPPARRPYRRSRTWPFATSCRLCGADPSGGSARRDRAAGWAGPRASAGHRAAAQRDSALRTRRKGVGRGRRCSRPPQLRAVREVAGSERGVPEAWEARGGRVATPGASLYRTDAVSLAAGPSRPPEGLGPLPQLAAPRPETARLPAGPERRPLPSPSGGQVVSAPDRSDTRSQLWFWEQRLAPGAWFKVRVLWPNSNGNLELTECAPLPLPDSRAWSVGLLATVTCSRLDFIQSQCFKYHRGWWFLNFLSLAWTSVLSCFPGCHVGF